MNNNVMLTSGKMKNLLESYRYAISQTNPRHPFFEKMAVRTLKNYDTGAKNAICALLKAHRDKHFSEILTPQNAQFVIDHIIDTSGPGAAKISLAAISSAMTFMLLYTDISTTEYNPFNWVMKPSIDQIKPWTQDQVTARVDSGNFKLASIVALLVESGQRLSDASRITFRDIENGKVCFLQQKTKTEVEFSVSKKLVEMFSFETIDQHFNPDTRILPYVMLQIHSYGDTQDQHESIVSSIRSRYLFESKACGLEPLPLHGLRKTFVLRAIAAGLSEFEIMAITGHKSTASLRHYYAGYDRKRASSSGMEKLFAHGA